MTPPLKGPTAWRHGILPQRPRRYALPIRTTTRPITPAGAAVTGQARPPLVGGAYDVPLIFAGRASDALPRVEKLSVADDLPARASVGECRWPLTREARGCPDTTARD